MCVYPNKLGLFGKGVNKRVSNNSFGFITSTWSVVLLVTNSGKEDAIRRKTELSVPCFCMMTYVLIGTLRNLLKCLSCLSDHRKAGKVCVSSLKRIYPYYHARGISFSASTLFRRAISALAVRTEYRKTSYAATRSSPVPSN